MKVLFVGDDWHGSNATSLRNAFVQRGHEVTTVNTRSLSDPVRRPVRRGWKRFSRSTYDSWAADRLDAEIRYRARGIPFQLVIGFKALLVRAETLESLPGVKLHYHPDDSSNPAHRSAVFDEAESAYDVHVTTKSFNVEEIYKRAGRPAVFMWCAYDPEWHVPMVGKTWSSAPRLGFIGTCRADRTALMAKVAERYRRKLVVVGSGWSRIGGVRKYAEVKHGAFGRAFSEAVSTAPLQLGLLNSDNRDLHTCRSIEVPAAGGLLIGQRTAEHGTLLEDGASALLFDSEQELWQLIDGCMESPAWARDVAARGQKVIRGGKNTYGDRVDEILRLSAEV